MAKGPQPGQRFGGRSKGTPNKDTKALRDLITIACSEDWDPVSEMARIAKEGFWTVYDPKTGEPMLDTQGNVVKERVDNKIRARFHEESAGYIHAKRKAVELSQDPNNPLIGSVAISFEGPEDEEPDET